MSGSQQVLGDQLWICKLVKRDIFLQSFATFSREGVDKEKAAHCIGMRGKFPSMDRYVRESGGTS